MRYLNERLTKEYCEKCPQWNECAKTHVVGDGIIATWRGYLGMCDIIVFSYGDIYLGTGLICEGERKVVVTNDVTKINSEDDVRVLRALLTEMQEKLRKRGYSFEFSLSRESKDLQQGSEASR